MNWRLCGVSWLRRPLLLPFLPPTPRLIRMCWLQLHLLQVEVQFVAAKFIHLTHSQRLFRKNDFQSVVIDQRGLSFFFFCFFFGNRLSEIDVHAGNQFAENSALWDTRTHQRNRRRCYFLFVQTLTYILFTCFVFFFYFYSTTRNSSLFNHFSQRNCFSVAHRDDDMCANWNYSTQYFAAVTVQPYALMAFFFCLCLFRLKNEWYMSKWHSRWKRRKRNTLTHSRTAQRMHIHKTQTQMQHNLMTAQKWLCWLTSWMVVLKGEGKPGKQRQRYRERESKHTHTVWDGNGKLSRGMRRTISSFYHHITIDIMGGVVVEADVVVVVVVVACMTLISAMDW